MQCLVVCMSYCPLVGETISSLGYPQDRLKKRAVQALCKSPEAGYQLLHYKLPSDFNAASPRTTL